MSDTAPLVPAGVDLTDFSFMPLDVRRLRDSKLAASVTGEAFRCAVLLWCASWHQLPAASLPDDDVELAQLAGFGRAVAQWKKARQGGALYGWVKCSDERLYHPVVAEKARESWQSKLEAAYRRECDRLRKENKRRAENKEAALHIPSFEQWNSEREASTFPTDFHRNSGGNSRHVQRNSEARPADSVLKGQGQGEVRDRDTCTRAPARMSAREDDAEAFGRLKAAYPGFAGNQADWILAERACLQRIEEGATWPELEAAADRFAMFVAAGGRSSPKYVDLPSKFFGNGLWREDWKPPPTKAEQRQSADIDTAKRWLEKSS